MTWDQDAYLRLGEHLRAARREAGYRTLLQFQEHLDSMPDKQLSGRTYADIENGRLRSRSRFSPESLAFLEDEFGWAPGVTRAILDGKSVDLRTGEPSEVKSRGWESSSLVPLAVDEESTDDLFAQIDHRLSVIETRLDVLASRFGPQPLQSGSGTTGRKRAEMQRIPRKAARKDDDQ